jgi:hypothetical protein
MLLALLIIALYGIGMGLLSDQIPNSSFSDPADSLTATLFLERDHLYPQLRRGPPPLAGRQSCIGSSFRSE